PLMQKQKIFRHAGERRLVYLLRWNLLTPKRLASYLPFGEVPLGEPLGSFRIKNFVFCRQRACAFKIHILILEVSQGGNSHQSETNLIERPLKQHLPGARKGFSHRSFPKPSLQRPPVFPLSSLLR